MEIKASFTDNNNFSCNVQQTDTLESNVSEQINHPSESDYEKLQNLPTLNGEVIKGNMNEIDPTVPSWAKEQTKPRYTANEVGAVDSESALTYAEIDELFNSIFKE